VEAALVIEHYVRHWERTASTLALTLFSSLVITLLLANTATHPVDFMYPNLTNNEQIPFVSADVEQYLTEWSSGHGIREGVTFIYERQLAGKKIAVGTEGYFGTLPDGILMYQYGRDVTGILVEGIGYPLTGIADSFKE